VGDENAALFPGPSRKPSTPAFVRGSLAPARNLATLFRRVIRRTRWSAVSLTKMFNSASVTNAVGRRKDASAPFAAARGKFFGTCGEQTQVT
jgi:hypothetical protein